MEEFSNPFEMMLQQERSKNISSGVSMGWDSLSTLVNIKSIVKWTKTSYHSFCKSGAFNVPNAGFNPCFNCDVPNHGIVSFPQKKDQKKISENKKKFIKMKQSQGVNGGGKTCEKISNKKGRANKSQK